MENTTTSEVSISYLNCPAPEYEYLQLLLEREKAESCYHSSSSFSSENLTKIARLDAINFILHTRAQLGFHLQTTYLSVSYLDRFVSLTSLNSEKGWVTELVSLGCLSLAAKLQEHNVPGLSSFQVGDFKFDVKYIQRMELLILNKLDWKMGSITPFSFLPYFISKFFSGPPPESTLTKIQELIFAIMKDISLMNHCPSAIALAAVLMSLDEGLKRNVLFTKISILSCNKFLDIDDVFVCYLIMQKLSHQMGSLQNSIATSSVSSKRESLSFNDNCKLKC